MALFEASEASLEASLAALTLIDPPPLVAGASELSAAAGYAQPPPSPTILPAPEAGCAPLHPFATEAGDHAETPLAAYQDIAPLLQRLAARLGTPCSALRIYDPYFCEGRCAAHLGSLGFASVYNRNEDFYAALAAGTTPEFDVLVTNPPFSGANIERIFTACCQWGKPFLLLLPAYVARKAFFLEFLRLRTELHAHIPRPVFLGPTAAPYTFTAPARADVLHMRGGAAATAEATGQEVKDADEQGSSSSSAAAGTSGGSAAFQVAAGSFQCVWFCSLGAEHHKAVVEWWRRTAAGGSSSQGLGTAALAAEVEGLPQLQAAHKLTPAERRWRKKLAAQQGAAAAAGGGEEEGGGAEAAAEAASAAAPALAAGRGGRGERGGGGGGGRPSGGGGGRKPKVGWL